MTAKIRGLSQGPYAMVAVPIVALLSTPLLANYAPVLLGWMGFHLANFAGPMIALQVACSLLIIPLGWAVIARLRHAGWTWWLALIVIVPGVLKMYFIWFPAPMHYPEWTGATVLLWFNAILWKLSCVAALALMFVPGRKAPPDRGAAF